MNNSLIQAGIGKKLSDSLWISAYDGYYLNASTENNVSALNDGYAEDGVHLDYTDTSSSADVKGTSRTKNNLAFSTYLNDKIGGTFYWNTDHTSYSGYGVHPTGELKDQNGTTSTKTESETNADNTTSLRE